jgi:hypothetical protein
MIICLMLARQVTILDSLPTKLTPLLRYSCKLLVALAKVKSFAIKQIRTLCAKYRGWGVSVPFDVRTFKTFRRSDAFLSALCFHDVTNPFSRLPAHLVLMYLQIPWRANPFSRITLILQEDRRMPHSGVFTSHQSLAASASVCGAFELQSRAAALAWRRLCGWAGSFEG